MKVILVDDLLKDCDTLITLVAVTALEVALGSLNWLFVLGD